MDVPVAAIVRLLGLSVAILLTWPVAAKAQAAWYALIPPPAGATAPLRDWEQLRAFDSAEECEKVVTRYAGELAAQTDNAARGRFARAQHVRCLHVSDPRLRPPT